MNRKAGLLLAKVWRQRLSYRPARAAAKSANCFFKRGGETRASIARPFIAGLELAYADCGAVHKGRKAFTGGVTGAILNRQVIWPLITPKECTDVIYSTHGSACSPLIKKRKGRTVAGIWIAEAAAMTLARHRRPGIAKWRRCFVD